MGRAFVERGEEVKGKSDAGYSLLNVKGEGKAIAAGVWVVRLTVAVRRGRAFGHNAGEEEDRRK